VRAVRRVARVAQRLPARRPRAVVLVYHRIGTGAIDPWQLTVDPEVFAGQMETLARDWSPMSLVELVDGFRRRRLPERGVAVTFDDGYADNLEVAAPILLEHAIPATLFVATDLIDAGGAPWWDELASLLLEPARLPSTLTLSSGNGSQWRIPSLSDEERRLASNLNPWEAQPGTRLRAFYEVWLTLRALDAARREAAIDEIAEWSDTPRHSEPVLLRWEQLREFAALPGFDLGAHTRTHPVLPSCSDEGARAEIAGGADRLRAQTGLEAEQFAYPFGAWSPNVARLVGELGFAAAYTTDGSAMSWKSSPHALPRVPAQGHASGEFAKVLADLTCR
jgi:peptidoglycan/xylan/chitin deacetylase (PgdA/CDA1 family)